MSGLRLSALSGLTGLAALSGCMGDPLPAQSPDFSIASYPAWREEDEAYRFYPGDKFRMDIRTAPELSAELTIAPDGRITLPTIGPVMAGGQTVRQLQTTLENIYGNELRDPALVITPTEFSSQKVFVGGEVKQAGVFELPGEIDVLQAILLAGGWTTEGQPTKVIVMRRQPGGEMMTRVVDVLNGLARRDLYDIGPLRRFDVIYVTRSPIADENLFVKQYVRDALPIDFSLFYDVARF
jgi:protein involved in polysaccharide export with SLBB domain